MKRHKPWFFGFAAVAMAWVASHGIGCTVFGIDHAQERPRQPALRDGQDEIRQYKPALIARTAIPPQTPSDMPIAEDGMIQSESGSIVVTVRNLRSSNGQMIASVYDSAAGFPSNADAALRKGVFVIEGGEATARFANLPYGDYAVSVCHDENGDGKMEKNFLGMPKEGVGVTGRPAFGMPQFRNAKFTLDKPRIVQTIKLKY